VTIRTRLTAWYSLVVVIVLAASAGVVATLRYRDALALLDGELTRLLLTLEGVMRTEFSEGKDLAAAAREASLEVVAPERTLLLVRANGDLLAVWGAHVDEAWRPASGVPAVQTIRVGDRRLRVVSRPFVDQDNAYVAAVLAPLDDLEAEHAQLLRALAIGVFVALAIAGVGGWVVGRQTLRPLAGMARQATAISEHAPTARLSTPNSRDELGRFAAAFNGLLDRLAASLNAQRQFMADASHELRTPVSVVRTAAQVTLARETRPEEEYRESLTIVAEQSERLARLVDSMFLLSRAEARAIPLVHEAVCLDDVVEDCARAVRVLAGERRIGVRTTGDSEVAFAGDDNLLRRMVTNLLDNAVRHARPGGSVVADVRQSPSGPVLRVIDDGPGIPAEDQARIFDRFVRLDQRSGGAGLGLPIARWIAEAHGGTLCLEKSDASGSSFRVSLPHRIAEEGREDRALSQVVARHDDRDVVRPTPVEGEVH
jgi:signal transduction histidine kinase